MVLDGRIRICDKVGSDESAAWCAFRFTAFLVIMFMLCVVLLAWWKIVLYCFES